MDLASPAEAPAEAEERRRAGRLTREQLASQPPALDLPEAARIVGIGRSAAYELVRTGGWPTPVLHLGHRIKIPTEPLLGLLGLSTSRLGPADSAGEPGAGWAGHPARGWASGNDWDGP
ncbi:MAG: helix-turn-helix transcriptional regulator [Mycobacteriales bacterium]